MVDSIYNPRVTFRSMITAAKKRRIANSFGEYPGVNEFTNAHEMTVYETPIWIWASGYNYGWLNAPFYMKSLKDNEIAGYMPPWLSSRMLEEDVGIRNRNHCMAIKPAIDFYFPRTKENHFRVQIGMGLGEQGHGNIVSMDGFMRPSTSMRRGSVSVCELPELVSSSDVSLPLEGNIRTNKIIDQYRRWLVLSLRPEQKVLG